MTISQLKELSNEELRERIAKILYPLFPTYWENGELRHRYPHYASERTGPTFNYPEDLNAMHQAEKTLSDKEHWKFRNALWDLTEIDGIPDDRAFYQANARQRAIAFLAVRGSD